MLLSFVLMSVFGVYTTRQFNAVYFFIFLCVCVCVYIYIYIYIYSHIYLAFYCANLFKARPGVIYKFYFFMSFVNVSAVIHSFYTYCVNQVPVDFRSGRASEPTDSYRHDREGNKVSMPYY